MVWTTKCTEGPPRPDGEQSTNPRDMAAPRLVTIDAAAAALSITPEALRARCRRNARREGRDVAARLGGGVVAYKLGASWRVQIPQ